METCGLICVSRDYEKFLMRCSYCPTDVEVAQWQEFVLHIRNVHSKVRSMEDDFEPVGENSTESGHVDPPEEKPQAEESIFQQDESADGACVQLHIDAVRSSTNETEESDVSLVTDEEESVQDEDPSEPALDDANLKTTPTYKVLLEAIHERAKLISAFNFSFIHPSFAEITEP